MKLQSAKIQALECSGQVGRVLTGETPSSVERVSCSACVWSGSHTNPTSNPTTVHISAAHLRKGPQRCAHTSWGLILQKPDQSDHARCGLANTFEETTHTRDGSRRQRQCG